MGNLSLEFDSVSGQLILIALLLMVASFYTGTLVSPSSSSSVAVLGEMRFPSRVALTSRTKSMPIPPTGVNVCPTEYNEHIPCHDASYTKFDLKFRRKEELESHCPPAEIRLFCLVPRRLTEDIHKAAYEQGLCVA